GKLVCEWVNDNHGAIRKFVIAPVDRMMRRHYSPILLPDRVCHHRQSVIAHKRCCCRRRGRRFYCPTNRARTRGKIDPTRRTEATWGKVSNLNFTYIQTV